MKKYYLMSAYFLILFIAIFSIVGYALAVLYPFKYKSEIIESANNYKLDPALVASIINVESSFEKDKVSPVGAIGLMQLMPATAIEIANKKGITDFKISDLYDVKTNIDFGCYYLRYLLDIYNNNLPNVLASYNAGLNKVKTWLLNSNYSNDGITLISTPYEETNNFIKKVNSSYKIYSKRF